MTKFSVLYLKNSFATQAQFASLVGITQQRVSQLQADGVLKAGASVGEWLAAYCDQLREQAAGRASDGDLDLVQERAALARSQRVGQDLKNAIAQGEYAPIGLLADVLSAVSSAVVDRFEALPGELRKACPDLPEAARTQIETTIASARNEWVRGTSELTAKIVDDLVQQEEAVDD
jgi:phage terminase Nu1 subunit (DNA packaging protein)